MAGTPSFLIIGQGLAGTTLGLKLHSTGLKVRLVDNGHRDSSTLVAAGMWNPVSFQRINLSWRAGDFIPAATKFYKATETLLDRRFCFPMEVWRKHASRNEENLWLEKCHEDPYSEFLSTEQVDFNPAQFVEFPYGYGVVRGAGFLDTPAYLHAARDYFLKAGALMADSDLTRDGRIDELARDIGADKVVDCRGYRAAESPRWAHLPFGLTKGDVLTLHCPDLKLEKIFNAGFYLLPIGEGNFKLGATFDREWKHAQPDERAKRELLLKFEKAVQTPYTVVDHRAGIRPTVIDRRPLLGVDPGDPKHCIFNGLGTKGVMMAPALADALLDHVIAGADLSREVDIARFDRRSGNRVR